MTDEEMREEISKLKDENKTLLENYDTIKSQVETKDKEITSLNENVSTLKQKNYDLFVKVQSQDDVSHIEKPKEIKVPSMNEVISKLKGGN